MLSQEADRKGDGTIKLEEFLTIFDNLFSLNGKVTFTMCLYSG